MPTTTKTKPRVEVLEKARALLAKRGGWMQGAMRRGDSFCAVGALRGVETYGTARYHDAIGAVLRAIGLDPDDSLASWNDEPKRKKREVLAAFDKAIRAAKRGGK